MSGVNKVILLGNLARDPETSFTAGGMAISKFTVVTSRKQKDGTEKASFHRCTAFNKSAELIGQYTSKGKQLYVEGELSYGQYEKDGQAVYTTDIIVNQFSFVGSKGGGQQSQNPGGYQQQNQQQGYQNNQQNQGFQSGNGGQQGGYSQGQQQGQGASQGYQQQSQGAQEQENIPF